MGGGHQELKPTKYFSIGDIPDSLVSTTSKREPENPFYKTRRWVNFKKRQILYSQRDGVPAHLRTPFKRFVYRSLWIGGFLLLGLNVYTLNEGLNKKKN